MKNQHTKGHIRMSELARLSGVSASTIKYYVKEGLVEIAYKTGPNMAYYHPDSITRVKHIKMLQTEKYYPLAVIKRLIDSNEFDVREIELLDVIHKTGRDSSAARYSFSEALRLSGLSREQAETLVRQGIVTPARERRRRMFRESDCRMLALVKTRLDAGIPFEQTLAAFQAYSDVLCSAAEQDIEGLISSTLLAEAHDTRSIVRIIRTSDDTLNEFIMLKRYEFNSAVGSDRIAALGSFIAAFSAYLQGLCGLFGRFGYDAQADSLDHALRGEASGVADGPLFAAALVMRQANGGLALALSACSKANGILRRPLQNTGAADKDADALLNSCLHLGWSTLSPKEFGAPAGMDAAETLLAHGGLDFLEAVTRLMQTCYIER